MPVAQRRAAAHRVSLGGFDLDDFGADIGHQAARKRARHHLTEIEHPDRAGSHPFSIARAMIRR